MTQEEETPAAKTPNEAQPEPNPEQETRVEETPFEAVASICSVLVVGLFILTFLAQNFVIPSGSMEKTLLVGDHLVVDRITLAPPPSGCRWFTIASPGAATLWSSSSRCRTMWTASRSTCFWSSG